METKARIGKDEEGKKEKQAGYLFYQRNIYEKRMKHNQAGMKDGRG